MVVDTPVKFSAEGKNYLQTWNMIRVWPRTSHPSTDDTSTNTTAGTSAANITSTNTSPANSPQNLKKMNIPNFVNFILQCDPKNCFNFW